MRILVVDDTEHHRNAALHQLKEHDVEAISSFDEAMARLGFHTGRFKPSQPNYDVVLTDLLMPSPPQFTERYATDNARDNGLFSFGMLIAFAALKRGIKRVAVVSLHGHYTSHPLSQAFGIFKDPADRGFKRFVFHIGDARVMLTCDRLNCMDAKTFEGIDGMSELEINDKYPKKERDANTPADDDHPREGLVAVKDWAETIKWLCMEQE